MRVAGEVLKRRPAYSAIFSLNIVSEKFYRCNMEVCVSQCVAIHVAMCSLVTNY